MATCFYGFMLIVSATVAAVLGVLAVEGASGWEPLIVYGVGFLLVGCVMLVAWAISELFGGRSNGIEEDEIKDRRGRQESR